MSLSARSCARRAGVGRLRCGAMAYESSLIDAFSAKMRGFLTLSQGVLHFCPSAPFSLDRH
ncbi:unnamed protein product [Mycetohabitans rhizoxinica HKI 454]|uniref:Uncharacterized protein n=1 Tax=Mycetohabitans rhizoxinica (strain DSM 19002 / CIP 109453 / HKI 454) TaxID=882378 RepID=E5ANY5_MYCRK|nr:unnamed protein product [Mycetohabitans rhizoxinica HKI 454]